MPDDDARLLLVPSRSTPPCDGTAEDVLRLASRALGDGVLVAQCAAVGLPFADMAAVALMLGGEYTLAEATLTDAQGSFGARGGWCRSLRRPACAGGCLPARPPRGGRGRRRLCVEEPAMAAGDPEQRRCGRADRRARRARAAARARRARRDRGGGVRPDALPREPIRARGRSCSRPRDDEEALAELEGSARLERDGGLNVGVTRAGARRRRCATWRSVTRGGAAAGRRGGDLARAFGASSARRRAADVRGRQTDEAMLGEADGAARRGALERARALVDWGRPSAAPGGARRPRRPRHGAELARAAAGPPRRARPRGAAPRRRPPRRLVRAGRDGLTPAELRVADLARRGNRTRRSPSRCS